jgi:hypothetical protein
MSSRRKYPDAAVEMTHMATKEQVQFPFVLQAVHQRAGRCFEDRLAETSDRVLFCKDADASESAERLGARRIALVQNLDAVDVLDADFYGFEFVADSVVQSEMGDWLDLY